MFQITNGVVESWTIAQINIQKVVNVLVAIRPFILCESLEVGRQTGS